MASKELILIFQIKIPNNDFKIRLIRCRYNYLVYTGSIPHFLTSFLSGIILQKLQDL